MNERIDCLFKQQQQALAGLVARLATEQDPAARRALLEECSVLLGLLSAMIQVTAQEQATTWGQHLRGRRAS